MTTWATRHKYWVNGVRLVLSTLSTTACAKAKTNGNAAEKTADLKAYNRDSDG